MEIRFNAGRAVCLVAAVVAAGCAKQSNVPKGDPAENIRKLTLAFVQFAAQNNGAGPADEATLKAFMVERDEITEDEAAKRFVSPRDNEPYVINWGAKPEEGKRVGPGSPIPPIIAYEKTGANGTRIVANGRIAVVEMSEEEFAEAVSEP